MTTSNEIDLQQSIGPAALYDFSSFFDFQLSLILFEHRQIKKIKN